MPTSDSNGLPVFNETDATVLHTMLNTLGSGVSNWINGTPRVRRAASIAARNALVTSIGPANITTSNPLLVWRADAPAGSQYEYSTNGGSTWHTIVTSQTATSAQVLFGDANVQVGFRERSGVVTVYAYGTSVLASGVAWEVATVPLNFRPTGYNRATGVLVPRQVDRVMSGITVASNGVITIINRTGAAIDGGWDATATYVL